MRFPYEVPRTALYSHPIPCAQVALSRSPRLLTHISTFLCPPPQASLERLKTFISYVSHEVRTPLNVISVGLHVLEKNVSGVSTLWMRDTPLHRSVVENISDMKLSVEVAQTTLNELLILDKLDRGLLTLEYKELKLLDFLRTTIQPFYTQAAAKEIIMHFIFDGVEVNGRPEYPSVPIGREGHEEEAERKVNEVEVRCGEVGDSCGESNGYLEMAENRESQGGRVGGGADGAGDDNHDDDDCTAEVISVLHNSLEDNARFLNTRDIGHGPVVVPGTLAEGTGHAMRHLSSEASPEVVAADTGRQEPRGRKLSKDVTMLHADPNKLAQVIRNLVSNALKFTPTGGTVTIRAYITPKDIHPPTDVKDGNSNNGLSRAGGSGNRNGDEILIEMEGSGNPVSQRPLDTDIATVSSKHGDLHVEICDTGPGLTQVT